MGNISRAPTGQPSRLLFVTRMVPSVGFVDPRRVFMFIIEHMSTWDKSSGTMSFYYVSNATIYITGRWPGRIHEPPAPFGHGPDKSYAPLDTHDILKMMKTEFPRCPEYYRPYADDFVRAWRAVSGNASWDPSKPDRRRIVAEAKDLYEAVRGYIPGFIAWALPEHIRALSKKGDPVRYVSGPKALRWLEPKFRAAMAARGQTDEDWQKEMFG